MLFLPFKLITFWYPESLLVFLRIWKNTLFVLEEDLAVGLMWKLLFTPLFHDSSFVGRILSFFFRLIRIFLGLSAMLIVSLIIIAGALVWLVLPVLAVVLVGSLAIVAKLLFFSGIILFIFHLLSHPAKKVWQIKSVEEIWKTTWVKKDRCDFLKLLQTEEVKKICDYLEQTPTNFSRFQPSLTNEILAQIWQLGKKVKAPYPGPEYFFTAMLLSISGIDHELLKLNLHPDDFVDALDFLNKKNQLWKMAGIWDEDFQIKHLKGINRGWLGVPTPELDQVAEDLTRTALKKIIPDFVGRNAEITRVINTISMEKGRNVLLVGEPGSGKSELVSYLAKLIVSGNAPATLATKRLVRLDLVKLMAGITSEGRLAQRLTAVFEDVKQCGNIVVFIDEIGQWGVGEADSQYNLYSQLVPFLESDSFQFIASTEAAGYSMIIQKNGSFARLFSKVELPPATIAETIDILKNKAIEYENSLKIKTSLPAIKIMVELANRLLHDLVLPDSALHIFEQATTRAENGWITKSVVEKVIREQTAMPIGEIGVQEKRDLLNLENLIHRQLVDQTEAVTAVANTLRRAAAGLRESTRPIGSFLFVGPTGVGKTELAKILVNEYFKNKGHFIRLDMSEYQTPESLNRLIGPTGESGQLTEAVHRHPYCLILMDEFEKASEKILTLFLQVLDDGRLTDGRGKTIDFTNTIIIATSNVASLLIAQALSSGQSLEQLKTPVKEELLKIFKPELINRFDGVVIFKPLSTEDLQKIVRLKLKGLQDKLQEQGYLVDFDELMVADLSRRGYDPVMGARPLRRLIQDTLEARLSTMILEGKLLKGEKLMVDQQLLL